MAKLRFPWNVTPPVTDAFKGDPLEDEPQGIGVDGHAAAVVAEGRQFEGALGEPAVEKAVAAILIQQ